MRYNIISDTSDGMGFAIRLLAEGSDARIWIRDSSAKEVGDGLVPKAGDLEDLLTDASKDHDVFIFDGSGNGVVADYLRSQGYAVLGGSVIADRLERDRQFGTRTMVECGIEVPTTRTFHSFADAKAYVKERGKAVRMVFKPSKTLGELFCAHVSYDQEDLTEYLTNVETDNSIAEPEFDLQDFVEGVALSTEVWFDGEAFLPLFNHTLERKELMDGNLGPSGGCTGNVVWACGDCPVCDEVRKTERFLRDNHYVGMLDLNAIVSDSGVFGLEWTPRFGYDASPTLFWQALREGSQLGRLFSDVAKRQYTHESPQLREGYAGAVRITLPPWPTEKYHAEQNLPILRLPKKYDEVTYFFNVKAHPEKPAKLVSAGAWGILLLFTGYGDSVKTSLAKPYKYADEVHVPNKQFRTDLAKQFQDDLTKLETILG